MKMISIEFYWDDLTEEKKEEIREKLGLDKDDNNNWDIVPMAILDIQEDEDA